MISVERINEHKVIELKIELDQKAINNIKRDFNNLIGSHTVGHTVNLLEAILSAVEGK